MVGQVIETEIEIDAPPERVWATFADFDRWPDWNPFARRLDGDVAVGETIAVRLEPPDGRGMTFKPRVLEFTPNRALRWRGKVVFPGVFDGEHQFRLEPVDERRTRFVQREEFSGLLVGIMMRSIRESTTNGFEAMNEALKEQVEASGP